MHDIYDPPPAPTPMAPPRPAPLIWTRSDLFCLGLLCLVLVLTSVLMWREEPVMATMTALGGSMVIFESWVTALSFLQRRRTLAIRARWTIFFAALLPWLAGLGIAASLMLGIFAATDWAW